MATVSFSSSHISTYMSKNSVPSTCPHTISPKMTPSYEKVHFCCLSFGISHFNLDNSSSRCSRFLHSKASGGNESNNQETEQAKVTLQQLDQQLDILRKERKVSKPADSPEREENARQNDDNKVYLPDLTNEFLFYTAFVLFMLTIFNNVLFDFLLQPFLDSISSTEEVLKEPISDEKIIEAPPLK